MALLHTSARHTKDCWFLYTLHFPDKNKMIVWTKAEGEFNPSVFSLWSRCSLTHTNTWTDMHWHQWATCTLKSYEVWNHIHATCSQALQAWPHRGSTTSQTVVKVFSNSSLSLCDRLWTLVSAAGLSKTILGEVYGVSMRRYSWIIGLSGERGRFWIQWITDSRSRLFVLVCGDLQLSPKKSPSV